MEAEEGEKFWDFVLLEQMWLGNAKTDERCWEIVTNMFASFLGEGD